MNKNLIKNTLIPLFISGIVISSGCTGNTPANQGNNPSSTPSGSNPATGSNSTATAKSFQGVVTTLAGGSGGAIKNSDLTFKGLLDIAFDNKGNIYSLDKYVLFIT